MTRCERSWRNNAMKSENSGVHALDETEIFWLEWSRKEHNHTLRRLGDEPRARRIAEADRQSKQAYEGIDQLIGRLRLFKRALQKKKPG